MEKTNGAHLEENGGSWSLKDDMVECFQSKENQQDVACGASCPRERKPWTCSGFLQFPWFLKSALGHVRQCMEFVRRLLSSSLCPKHPRMIRLSLKTYQKQFVMLDRVPVKDLLLLLSSNARVFIQEL